MTESSLCRFRQRLSIQTGMMPAASPTKCCKSCCSVPESDALRQDLHNKRRTEQFSAPRRSAIAQMRRGTSCGYSHFRQSCRFRKGKLSLLGSGKSYHARPSASSGFCRTGPIRQKNGIIVFFTLQFFRFCGNMGQIPL